MDNTSKYYVYVYLDPRKVGDYTYGDLSFSHEPFYVGKGFDNRRLHHLKCRGKNYPKNHIIRTLLLEGTQPTIITLCGGLTEESALNLEVNTISKIGRMDLLLGPLTNLTDGGEGHSGHIQSDETKRKRGETKRKRGESLLNSTFYNTVRSDEFRRNASEHFKEYYSDINNVQRLSISRLGDKNPMFGKKGSEKQKEAVRLAHKEGRIKLTDEGRRRLGEPNRKGVKNSKRRIDIVSYLLITPNDETIEVEGCRELQNICVKHKIQFHTLKQNLNTRISKLMVRGTNNYAKNTINWGLIRLSDGDAIQLSAPNKEIPKFDKCDPINRIYRRDKYLLTSPHGEIHTIYGEKSFLEFVKTHSLSERKLREFINRGVVNITSVKIKREQVMATINWEIKKLKYYE